MSQWADDSMTPSPIGISRDKFKNEVPSDRPYHDEATPGLSGWHFDGNQYDDSPGKGGFAGYGVPVNDLGQNPKVERSSVNVSRSNRGSEQ